jgi:hypothetical protein
VKFGLTGRIGNGRHEIALIPLDDDQVLDWNGAVNGDEDRRDEEMPDPPVEATVDGDDDDDDDLEEVAA